MRMKNTDLICLFTILAAIPGVEGHAKLQLFCQTSTILELPIPFPVLSVPDISVVPVRPEVNAKVACGRVAVRYLPCNCRGRPYLITIDRGKKGVEETVDAMGRAYLKCKAIRVYRLAPEIRVEYYPEGHFGSWARDGLLISDRIEFTDEVEMRRIFLLLVETMDDIDDEYDLLVLAFAPKMTLAEYRKEVGFNAELSFEFVGNASLQVDISTRSKRMIVQVGEQWTSFALDRWSAEALQEFVPRRL